MQRNPYIEASDTTTAEIGTYAGIKVLIQSNREI